MKMPNVASKSLGENKQFRVRMKLPKALLLEIITVAYLSLRI